VCCLPVCCLPVCCFPVRCLAVCRWSPSFCIPALRFLQHTNSITWRIRCLRFAHGCASDAENEFRAAALQIERAHRKRPLPHVENWASASAQTPRGLKRVKQKVPMITALRAESLGDHHVSTLLGRCTDHVPQSIHQLAHQTHVRHQQGELQGDLAISTRSQRDEAPDEPLPGSRARTESAIDSPTRPITPRRPFRTNQPPRQSVGEPCAIKRAWANKGASRHSFYQSRSSPSWTSDGRTTPFRRRCRVYNRFTTSFITPRGRTRD